MNPNNLPAISDRNLRFCELYLHDHDAARAALQAGILTDPEAAVAVGNLLLGEDYIQAWLGYRYMRTQQAKRLRITLPKILRDLEIIAFSNIKNYVANARGQLDVRPGLSKSLLKAVKQYSIVPARISGGKHETAAPHLAEIELHDKFDAICELLRHFNGLPLDDADEDADT